MWSIWDKTTEINGYPAEYYFKIFPHLVGEETIFIYAANGRVTSIEGKNVLANHYGIDPALPDDEFIAAYEAITAEPEDTDTTTYAELAQVYAEGVNSIE